MKLSVVVPVYNEAATLEQIVRRVLAVNLAEGKKELIIVDDGSSDGSRSIVEKLEREFPDVIQCIYCSQNRGKGAAVRQGLDKASGDIIIVQDADLEYDPEDFRSILGAYSDSTVQVVFGARKCNRSRISDLPYFYGRRVITALTNLLYGSQLTDQPTCYKSARASALASLDLRCNGFEFCAEVTAKLLRAGYKIVEVPISYQPRSIKEGKKLRARDGLRIAWTLLRLRFGGS